MQKFLNRRQSGWSLVELTIILIVLSILCAILMPVISIFVHKAKICRAREDVQAIGVCIWMYICDTANPMFFIDGSGPGLGSPARANNGGGAPNQRPSDNNRVNVLVGDGDIPHMLGGLSVSGPNGDGWGSPVNNTTVDFFERHLVTNNPGGDPTRGYRTPLDLTNPPANPMFSSNSSAGFNSEFAWRGPYITGPIIPDPWGNRYMANVVFLDPIADSDGSLPSVHTNGLGGFVSDVVVITAATDEEIDTPFGTGTMVSPLIDGLTPGDDDILYVASANSRP